MAQNQGGVYSEPFARRFSAKFRAQLLTLFPGRLTHRKPAPGVAQPWRDLCCRSRFRCTRSLNVTLGWISLVIAMLGAMCRPGGLTLERASGSAEALAMTDLVHLPEHELGNLVRRAMSSSREVVNVCGLLKAPGSEVGTTRTPVPRGSSCSTRRTELF